MSESTGKMEIYNHKIEWAADEPFRIFASDGNLIAIVPDLAAAKALAMTNRVRELTNELSNITNLPEWKKIYKV